MRQKKYEFQWFEQEDRRKTLRASVGKDGKLRLGKPLREKLPQFIRIGFDPRFKVLAIADGYGAGIKWPNCGILTAEALTDQLSAAGIHPPVSFCLSKDACTGFFIGRIVPHRHRVKGSSEKQYDPGQLLTLYPYIIDNAVRQLAKSTPRDERKAIATEAFLAAAREYRAGCGKLETYLEKRVISTLLQQNKQYVKTFRQRSLDQPISHEEGNDFCLYDTIPATFTGGIDALEEQIAAEQFLKSLPSQEQKLAEMLQSGFLVSEIKQELDMSEAEVTELAQAIGRKWKRFNDDQCA